MALVNMKSSLLSLTYYQPNFNKVANPDVENNLQASLKYYFQKGTPTVYNPADLETTLKSALEKDTPTLYTEQNKYGKDRFGAVPFEGQSNLPYIRTKIPGRPNKYTSGTRNPIIIPTTAGNLDYPIRGGQIAFELGQQTYTSFSTVDRDRIAAFLKDAPRGDTFLKKQVGLQLTNPKMETGMMYGILQNTRVYEESGRNTLAQVLASGTGAHAIRHGNTPFNPIQKTYFATVNEQNVMAGMLNEQNALVPEATMGATGMNRLVILHRLKMLGKNPVLSVDAARSAGLGLNMERVNNLGISLNRNTLFQYLGGPGSSYGIGATTINRVVDSTQAGAKLKYANTLSYDQIASRKAQKDNPNPEISDFRFVVNAEDRLIGAPWSKEDTIDYKFYVANSKKDRLNTMMPFLFKNDSNPWDVPNQGDQSSKDLIKFVFEAISNDNTSYSTAIFFRAFLTAGITDNNSAALNAFKYVGRGENFYTYQGFDRTIAFSFRVAAHSKEELKPMYNRLNALVSQVYPDYSPNTQIMRAPLMRMTVGDYLHRMPGLIESVNITVGNDMPWEINLYNDENLAQVPQVVDVSISFKPILTELPRRYGSISSVKTDNNESGIETTTVERNATSIIANNGSFIESPPIETTTTTTTQVRQQPTLNPNTRNTGGVLLTNQDGAAAQQQEQKERNSKFNIFNRDVEKAGRSNARSSITYGRYTELTDTGSPTLQGLFSN